MLIAAMLAGAVILAAGILIGAALMLLIHNAQNAEADD